MKRFLALTIAVMMIISGMALNVSANTTFSDVEDNALGEAINILAELELVLGNNGKFNGEDTLTRQEFALFVARIHSARPEWFVGSGAPTTFADDAEIALWAKTAVQYCYDNGIVNGIGGNRFGPERDVLMQEAVAMLVRSLGYTGLVYPFGELSVAAQVKDTARDLGDVALIGIGVDPELDIESKLFADGSFSPTDPLTRNAMAALLYNYFMNAEHVVYNVVIQGGQIGSTNKTYIPVAERFGIKEMTGYITGVKDWSIDLGVVGIDSTNAIGPVSITGSPAQPAAVRNAHELVISWGDHQQNDRRNVTATERKEFFDSAFGKLTDEELLGLKVVFYVDSRLSTPSNVVFRKIPAAKLIGNKYEVDAGLSESTWNGDEGFHPTITLGTIPDAAAWKYDQSNEVNTTREGAFQSGRGLVPYFNVYSFTENKISSTLSNDILNELGSFAGSAGKNFRLEYVDNGIDAAGDNEFYYIFRPFQVGYRTGNDDGNIRFSKDITGDGARATGDRKSATDMTWVREIERTQAEFDAYFVEGGAYFYTNEGRLDIYGKLTPETGAVLRAYTSTRAQFQIGTAATFTVVAEGSGDQNNAETNRLKAFDDQTTNTFTLYRDPETKAPLLARRTAEGNPGADSRYGVVMSAGSSVFVDNELKWALPIYDINAGTERTLLLTGVTSSPSGIGTYVRIISDTQVAAVGGDTFTQSSESRNAYAGTDYDFSANVITMGTVTALVNSSTKITAVKHDNSVVTMNMNQLGVTGNNSNLQDSYVIRKSNGIATNILLKYNVPNKPAGASTGNIYGVAIADGSAMGDSLYKVLVYEGGELKDSIKAYGGAGFDGHLVRVTTTEKDFLGDVRSQVVSIDNVASRIAKTESQVVNTGLDEVLTMTRGRVVSLENETSIVVETDKYFTLDGIKQYRKVNLSGTKIGDNYDWNVHGFNGAAVSGMNLYAVVYSETSTGKVISVTLALDTGAIEIEVESITKETETTLEITFDDDAFVLASEDIKFSGAGSATVVSVANDGDGVWTVTINVTTAGAVTVSIAKPGFVFEQWTENIVLTMV